MEESWDEMYFFFNDTATTEIYTLSLHDALPISVRLSRSQPVLRCRSATTGWPAGSKSSRRSAAPSQPGTAAPAIDRKSTRLNSSHANISYAVFCLKKKNTPPRHPTPLPSSDDVD